MTETVPRDHAAAAAPAGLPGPALTATLALRFVLELAALGALAYWGLHTGESMAADLALGLGAPLFAAAMWGIWAAPKSATRLRGLALLMVQMAILGAGAAALMVADQLVAGVGMAALIAVNAVFLRAQDGR